MIKKIILSILICFTLSIASDECLIDSTKKYLPKDTYSQIISIDKLPDWCMDYVIPKGNVISIDSIRAIEQIDKYNGRHIRIATIIYQGTLREYRLFSWYQPDGYVGWTQDIIPKITKTRVVGNYYICR